MTFPKCPIILMSQCKYHFDLFNIFFNVLNLYQNQKLLNRLVTNRHVSKRIIPSDITKPPISFLFSDYLNWICWRLLLHFAFRPLYCVLLTNRPTPTSKNVCILQKSCFFFSFPNNSFAFETWLGRRRMRLQRSI